MGEDSLAVQWLELHASTVGGAGLIPGWGTKISHVAWSSQKKKRNIQWEKVSPASDVGKVGQPHVNQRSYNVPSHHTQK